MVPENCNKCGSTLVYNDPKKLYPINSLEFVFPTYPGSHFTQPDTRTEVAVLLCGTCRDEFFAAYPWLLEFLKPHVTPKNEYRAQAGVATGTGQ